jgi:hypothetical protein
MIGMLSIPVGGQAAPVNDNVSNALVLDLGQSIVFNNAGATVQVGEVTPGRGSGLSCRAQDGWCGFKIAPSNSVWFSFEATADPVAVFVEHGMGANLQLALWQASDIDQFASYLKLAANDDGNDQYAPGILPTVDLAAGAHYLIQVSGQPGYTESQLKASVVQHLPLANGHLGPASIGLFKFSLAGDIGALDYFSINTEGSGFDTEIGLYDSQGRLLASNNNVDAYRTHSQLRFGFGGVNGASLSAGDYTLVLGGFNTIFETGNINTYFPHAGDFQIDIHSTQIIAQPARASFVARDGHHLPADGVEIEIARGHLKAGEIQFFPILVAQDIGPADWFAIHTHGSLIDTEIALYDAHGRLIAENNNMSSYNLLSRLSFGFDADHGASLAAGQYTLALGAFNSIFREGLQATSYALAEGEFAIYMQTPLQTPLQTPHSIALVIPEPSRFALIGVGLGLILLRRRWHSANELRE